MPILREDSTPGRSETAINVTASADGARWLSDGISRTAFAGSGITITSGDLCAFNRQPRALRIGDLIDLQSSPNATPIPNGWGTPELDGNPSDNRAVSVQILQVLARPGQQGKHLDER
jgi:hypothetical protein